jgi:hypothetical protein
MTFLQYLRRQQSRDDPIGDFARDALKDKSKYKPRGMSNLSMWEEYLGNSVNACAGARAALRAAWQDYTSVTIDGA